MIVQVKAAVAVRQAAMRDAGTPMQGAAHAGHRVRTGPVSELRRRLERALRRAGQP